MNPTAPRTDVTKIVAAARRLGHDFGIVIEVHQYTRHVWLVEVEQAVVDERRKILFTRPHPQDKLQRRMGMTVDFTYPKLTAVLEISNDPRGLQDPALANVLDNVPIRNRWWFVRHKGIVGNGDSARGILAEFVDMDGQTYLSNPPYHDAKR